LVILGIIIVLIMMNTQYITSQLYFIGVLVIAGIITFGVMVILTMKFKKWGWM